MINKLKCNYPRKTKRIQHILYIRISYHISYHILIIRYNDTMFYIIPQSKFRLLIDIIVTWILNKVPFCQRCNEIRTIAVSGMQQYYTFCSIIALFMISLNSILQNAKQTVNNEFGERWMFYSTRSSPCENIFTTALINIHYVHINIISYIYII